MPWGMVNAESAAVGQDCLDCRMWGKEQGLPGPYPVVCHLLDTAAVFLALWDEVVGDGVREQTAEALGLGGKETRCLLAFWAGLHDLGKITPPFQAQVVDAFNAVKEEPGYAFAVGAEKERAFRHEMATHWSLAGLLADEGYPQSGRRLLKAAGHHVAQLLGGHHGRYGPVLVAEQVTRASAYQPGLGGEGWAAQRRIHFEELRRLTGGYAVPQSALPAELAVVVSGLVVVSDWIASQTEAILPLMPAPGWCGTPPELDTHWVQTLAAAPAKLRATRIGRATFASMDFDAMFPFTPNPLQRDIVENLPTLVNESSSGLVLITAPTGDGKTEAALFAAGVLSRAANARGLYFALPTMATADGMYPRVRRFVDRALAGERAVALLHSMAWLSPVYNDRSQTAPGESGEAGQTSAEATTALEADAWLRGSRRGLLAALGVGTIDQALAAILPLKYNALRLFALSDKVFVVDEAHAYGPWMHKLLTILLEWLGAMKAPVVLLSATLTGKTATSLVDAYRRGAGHLEPSDAQPCYPGWLYVDSDTGAVSTPRGTHTERQRAIAVSLQPVRWDTGDAPASAPVSGGRREALRLALRRVAEAGGTALVCCTTVAEAQQTYRDLRAAFPDLAQAEGGLRLLHSRYSATRRQKITQQCEAAYGKPSSPADTERPRPASILVATQVVEQSLDFDFDLVVTDLAPLAQLLQRAGRARRHARGTEGRPAWAADERTTELVVLEPVDTDGHTERPRSWGSVYDHSLLIRTARLLHARTTDVAVPGDIQELIDAVYAEEFVEDGDASAARELRAFDAERRADEMAEHHLATMVGIRGPADVGTNLHLLSRHEQGVTEELLTTRLGADTGRLLCLYEQPDGSLALSPDGTTKLPRSGRPSRADIACVVSHAAPVPGRWLRDAGEDGLVPASWSKQALLRDLVPIRMRPDGHDSWTGRNGQQVIRTSEVGLEAL